MQVRAGKVPSAQRGLPLSLRKETEDSDVNSVDTVESNFFFNFLVLDEAQ